MKKKYFSLILFIFTIIISAQTPTGSSTEAGLTAGNLSVSLTGAANYAVPINLPPGINEVVPRISLAYNSQGADGMAANGWDIAGISKIKRIPKTRFHDGNVENYKLTPQDRFALDGQRLMLKSGTYGTHNSVYELEKFSQVKITMLYGMIEPWEEIQYYFMAEYPDGSKAMYGNKSDAQSAYEWAIVSWENAQGVKINYSYNTTGGYLSIATIKYGSRGLTAPINEVRFTYTASQRKNENYIANGYKIIRNSILSKIEVMGNGTGYRNYFIAYTTGDRISSITEKNGDNSKSYNPIVFSYDSTADNITYSSIGASLDIGNITASNAAAISGDFDDDGKMDCIVYPITGTDSNAKYWLFNDITSGNNTNLGLPHNVGKFEKIFPTTWLSWNNKMMPQGWTIAKKTDTGFDFTVWSTSMSTIIPQYTRTVNFPTTPIITKCYTNCNSDIVNKIYPKKIISGDFNGDGLTDVIAFDLPLAQGECVLDDYSLSICELRPSNLLSRKVYFIDLKRDNTSDYLKYAGDLSANITDDSDTEIKVADFNGDGKSDFYIFYRGTLRIYSLNEQNNVVLLYENSDGDTTLEGPLLFGDFNGDGKSDFMGIPPSGSTWYKYTSTGISYLKETKNYTGIQLPTQAAFTGARFIALNYNNDKLTDLALVVSSSTNASNAAGSVDVKCFINNNGDFTTSTGFTVSANTGIQSTLSFGALPIFVSPTESNSRDSNFAVSTLELAFINKNKVHFFNSQKNYLKDNLIKTATLGNGVKESISYVPLNSIFKNIYNSIYNPSSGISNFPNMDITINPNIYIVSKIEKQSSSVYKKRLFAYYGAVSSLDRREFIGFRSVSQSDWHDDSSVIFSTVYNNNIDLRAANIEKFTVPYMYYPYGAASPSDFTTKQLTTYETAVDPLQANKVYKLKILNYKNFNSITDINNETAEIQYDTYNNITSSKTYTKKGSTLAKTMTVTKGYDFVASPYFVGRPKNKTISVTANNHTMTSTEAYTYNSNNLLSNIDKSATGTSTISESNIYDIYGNVTKKTITSQVPVQSRSMLFEYDSSGRFITKMTDNDNLTATYEYYPENGLVKKETNPYKSFSYTYDSWLKKITQKNNLLNTTTSYSYVQNASKTIVTTTEDPLDGNISEEIFDDLGRQISTGSKNINGSFTYVSYVYDIFDRLTKKSEPYFGTTPVQWNETQYDIYSRPLQNISFNGKTVSNLYNGLVTTNTEGIKSKVLTKNALGNTVSVSETSAGEITYNYFADGNLKQVRYNGISLDIEQDGWGRKTKFKDPSNGDYTYAYNDYDELTEEKSQNGNVVTTITRDSNGRPVKKTIIGGGTDSETNYTYDNTKLPTTIIYEDKNEPVGTRKIETTITYDNTYKRILSIVENKVGISKFTRSFTYDGLGRVATEIKLAEIGGKSSSVYTQNVYKNGTLYQIKDVNNKVLWQANTLNAKGQILEGIIGNGIKNTYTYDNNGYLSKIQSDKTTAPIANIITLTSTFDKNTSNLDSRTNNVFGNYTENFKYDELNRLKTFTNRLGIEETQSYDAAGKIAANNLGTYGYDSTKKYQNNSIALSAEAAGYYANREGVFNDSMEDKTGWGTEKYPNTNFYSYDGTKAGHSAGKNTLKLANTTTAEQYVYSDKWIELNNTAPTQYTYSAWVYSDSPQSEIVLVMKDAAGVLSYNTNVSSVTGQWTQIVKTFLVPANIKKIRLRLDNNGLGNIWYDDAEIRKTSDPSSNLRKLAVTYNSFKAPIQIEEINVDKINFTYTDGNTRSSMYYGSFDTDKSARPFRKHYSSDGSMEIKENKATGSYEFITYIGGDGYTAPIAVKSNGTVQNYLYLHRDYQGSILAVTDANAAVVEKRLFDGWGNIIKVQDGSGNTLNGLTVLDRGYTGHEHLQSVGIIHMNARLYDPMLHRFLQVDNYIQDLSNTQNFNQYAYVFNNPASYVDLSGNSADPPAGTNYRDEYEYKDEFGSWIYDAKSQTWFGVDGSPDITVGAVNLSNVTIGGVNHNNYSYGGGTSLFSGMSGNFTGGGAGNDMQKASFMDGNVSLFDVANFGIGFAGYSISQVQSAAEAEMIALKSRNTLTSLAKLAKVESGLVGANKFARGLGVAGVILTTGKVVYDYTHGKDLTAGQVADVAIAVGLAALTISNPVALVGFGIYGILDATGALDSIKSSLGGDTVILKSNFEK